MQKKVGEVNSTKIDILWQMTRLPAEISAGVMLIYTMYINTAAV
jgi:hypothetical protein